jgi:hypothetical protein
MEKYFYVARKNTNVANIPKDTTEIEFCVKFDRPINNLPKQLKKVSFKGDKYTHTHNLPNKLSCIENLICSRDNVNYLPSSIKILNFKNYFSLERGQLYDNLPNSIMTIQLSYLRNFKTNWKFLERKNLKYINQMK